MSIRNTNCDVMNECKSLKLDVMNPKMDVMNLKLVINFKDHKFCVWLNAYNP